MYYVYEITFDNYSNTRHVIVASGVMQAITQAIDLSQQSGEWFEETNVKSVTRGQKIAAVAS